MTTKEEMIAIIKAENPTIQIGDEDSGYTDLTGAEYDAQIAEWADGRLVREARESEQNQAIKDKAALLAKLGITADEFKLLIG